MSEVSAGNYLPDTEKGKYSPYNIFDRIINLKLIAGKKGEDEFVIRSDYEAAFTVPKLEDFAQTNDNKGNDYIIRRCQIKPSIKVEYSKVTNSTSIDIDIYLSNFYMYDTAGQVIKGFNNITYPLKRIELMMGYIGQFESMPHSTLEDLRTFVGSYGVDVIHIQPQYVNTENVPPDYTLHIHGTVGTALNQNAGENTIEDFENALNDIVIDTTKLTHKRTAVEEIYYQYITRRYLKNSAPVALRDTELRDYIGRYTEDVADKYGVKIYATDSVKEYSRQVLEKTFGRNKKEDKSNGKKIKLSLSKTLGADLINLESQICSNSEIKHSLHLNGDLMLFTDKDLDPEHIFELLAATEEAQKEGAEKEDSLPAIDYFDNKLPAIYNININGVMVIISSPFYFFTNNFAKVKFKARYPISDAVTYWSGTNTVSEFYVLQQRVSFATVEEVNEVIMTCSTEPGK